MQPTYLPWIGYFRLLSQVDHFVFLDAVKFEKSSWQHRNQFLIAGKTQYLSVPVSGSRNQLIKDVEINEQTHWRRKHLTSLKQSYGKHPFFYDFFSVISPIIEDDSLRKLSKLNCKLILEVSRCLDLSPAVHCNRKLSLRAKGRSD